MNTDLRPFYSTAHNLLVSLQDEKSVRFNQVYRPDWLHSNQFQALINILNRLEIITTRVLLPIEDDKIMAQAVARGKRYDEFRKWLPDDSSGINPSKNEYYLLYLEYSKRDIKSFSAPFIPCKNSENVYLLTKLLSKSELFKFFVELSKRGKTTISVGYQSLPTALPSSIAIYDLTKTDGYTTKNTREGFQFLLDQVNLSESSIDDTVLNNVGQNVTSQLGFNLEDIHLHYFETYYRLVNFYPEFEKVLVNELLLPTQTESPEFLLHEKTSGTDTEVVAENDIQESGELSRTSAERLPVMSTNFRYGLFYPTLKDDQIEPCFKVELIASVLADHISKLEEETGQMVGIFGKWGRGKTYFKKELKRIIDSKSEDYKFNFITFHAWKYQDTPAIWAYLYERLSEGYFGAHWFEKHWRRLKLNFQRGKSKLIKDVLFIGLMWSLVTVIFSLINNSNSGFIGDIFELVEQNWGITVTGGTLVTTIIRFSKREGANARDLLKKYTKGISFNQHLGVQAEIEKELVTLLKLWIPEESKDRLILFVDDIDRCSERKIIELVDSLRVMLEHPKIVKRVIVLVAIDEEKLDLAIRHKYREFYPQTTDNEKKLDNLVSEYMDKLFISGIKLQALNKENIREFITTLVEQDWKDIPEEKMKKEIAGANEKMNLSQAKQERVNDLQESAPPQKQETKPTDHDKIEQLDIIVNPSSDDVIDLFMNELEDLKEELTPRQIRILYYRFQLAKNLYIKLSGAENDQLITNKLNALLNAIRVKSISKEQHRVEDPIINQIAEMVVGY